MPDTPHASTSRAVGVLFASGLLIVFAGLAGLGATAISVLDASGENAPPPTDRRPALQPAVGKTRYASVSASERLVLSRRSVFADTAMKKEMGWIILDPSFGRPGDPVPLAQYDENSR